MSGRDVASVARLFGDPSRISMLDVLHRLDGTARAPRRLLGAALCSAVLDAGWAIRRPASRALLFPAAGEARLRELGVVL